MAQPGQSKGKSVIGRKKRITTIEDEMKSDIEVIAKTILEEAKKRAKYEVECLTELVLQEARIVSRYARERPFYIA